MEQNFKGFFQSRQEGRLMTSQTLTDQIGHLVKKPGHENVRHILSNILKEQLGAKQEEIDFEERLLACQGRIDALWGRTIFEVKRDLKKELLDAESQIKRYIQSKQEESNTGEKYVGIATDGQKYKAYFLFNGELKAFNQFVLNEDKASEFIQWLESVILIKKQLEPTPEIICKEIGQGSPLCRNALIRIKSLWGQAKHKKDIRLKYNLWKKSVDIVYGKEVDESLFIEHTYLTIVSKAIAHAAFFPLKLPSLGKYLLNGKLFKEININDVIEDDFFSWVTFCPAGNNLIRQIASHVLRFDFSNVQADILKSLYEGLIRQEQRHKMGEYYTPDWLAQKICKEVIKKPLENRVIDPACGSGTFLFHSIRLLISKAEKKGLSPEKTINLICDKIAGIDIHPVAVIFARITYLLAILKIIKRGRPGSMSIPVYLGDSLQWSIEEVLGGKSLKITVPADRQTGAKRRQLVFPESVCLDRSLFEETLTKMRELAGKYKETEVFQSWIKKQSIKADEVQTLTSTYKTLLQLQKEDRNHIWTHVTRNLTRPIWLSSKKQKADIVIGNPPWLKFNSMNPEMQKTLKEECLSLNLWDKKTEAKFRASQDISTYFLVRSVELYMKKNGELAFVMPYNVMNGKGHYIFREGTFERNSRRSIHIKFKSAWVFDSEVKNLFEVPSCVLFSVRKENSETTESSKKVLFPRILSFKGVLPKKNASIAEAIKALSQEEKEWPVSHSNNHHATSYYYDRFKQGATLVPRRFIFVEKVPTGPLGSSTKNPFVRGIDGNQDKSPWKEIEPIERKIESQFLKPVYTGQSIAPFRTLKTNLAVIPWSKKTGVMSYREAELESYLDLSAYLEQIEELWDKNSSGKMTFKQRINYQKLLENQFPISRLRLVYAASGTYPAAVLLENKRGIIDTKLYWTSISNLNEGLYLEGILNSDSLMDRIRGLQSQGQWGARDIHRHLLKPYFPKYDSKNPFHQKIVDCVQKIKKIALSVPLDSSWKFQKSRQQIRKTIQEAERGTLWKQLNHLVNTLLEKGKKHRPHLS